MKIVRESIIPKSHLCLWETLYETLPNELIIAGSFASAQARYNKFGSTNSYNDIDFWYNEDHEELTRKSDLEGILGRNIVIFFLRYMMTTGLLV